MRISKKIYETAIGLCWDIFGFHKGDNPGLSNDYVTVKEGGDGGMTIFIVPNELFAERIEKHFRKHHDELFGKHDEEKDG